MTATCIHARRRRNMKKAKNVRRCKSKQLSITKYHVRSEGWNIGAFPFASPSLPPIFTFGALSIIAPVPYWAYQIQKLHKLSWTHPPLMRLRELHAQFLHVTIRIWNLKCDWSIRADVTEIILVAWVHRHYFSAETSDSRKYVWVHRLALI